MKRKCRWTSLHWREILPITKTIRSCLHPQLRRLLYFDVATTYLLGRPLAVPLLLLTTPTIHVSPNICMLPISTGPTPSALVLRSSELLWQIILSVYSNEMARMNCLTRSVCWKLGGSWIKCFSSRRCRGVPPLGLRVTTDWSPNVKWV